MRDVIIDKLKEIKSLQNNIKLDNIEYTTKKVIKDDNKETKWINKLR